MGRSKSIPMRLDKFEFSGIHTENPRTPTKEERRVVWNRVAKRYMKAMGYIANKTPSIWLCMAPNGNEYRVSAHTKSEARSVFKGLFGIPKSGRLPVGTVITKVSND